MEAKVKIEKKDFIMQSKKFQDHYIMDKENIIWQNETGFLTRCQHKTTKVIRAVKIIYKYLFEDFEGFCTEIQKLKELVLAYVYDGEQDHPNIIRLHEYFDDAKYFYLILDLCTGGELLEKVSEIGSFTEASAAMIFKQMVEAVGYCNSRGLYHRDLTARSFMFLKPDPSSPLMLVDLGLSRLVRVGKIMAGIMRVAKKKRKLESFKPDVKKFSLRVVALLYFA